MACGCSNGNSCSGTVCDQCGSSCVPGTPTPYYNNSPAVQESRGLPIVQQILVAALSSSRDFVIPACGVEGIMWFFGLSAIQVGSYLWNATFGYFRVTGFNANNGEVKVINECLEPNADPGTLIPRCTQFTITAPPWNSCFQCAGDGYVYVFPAGPPPIPAGDPFALDIDTIVGNVITLRWHSIPVVP